MSKRVSSVVLSADKLAELHVFCISIIMCVCMCLHTYIYMCTYTHIHMCNIIFLYTYRCVRRENAPAYTAVDCSHAQEKRIISVLVAYVYVCRGKNDIYICWSVCMHTFVHTFAYVPHGEFLYVSGVHSVGAGSLLVCERA